MTWACSWEHQESHAPLLAFVLGPRMLCFLLLSIWLRGKGIGNSLDKSLGSFPCHTWLPTREKGAYAFMILRGGTRWEGAVGAGGGKGWVSAAAAKFTQPREEKVVQARLEGGLRGNKMGARGDVSFLVSEGVGLTGDWIRLTDTGGDVRGQSSPQPRRV